MTLTRHVDSALSGSRSSGFLLLLDVDNFKRLNDTYGHPAGDRVLVAVAGILQDRFGRCGIVGRLGGDEFAVYAGGMSAADMRAGAEFVCRSLTELTLEGVEGILQHRHRILRRKAGIFRRILFSGSGAVSCQGTGKKPLRF